MRDESSRSGESPAALVRGLHDLQRGRAVQLRLALGWDAVDPLGEFLLGPPAPHPQPRMLAAEALGAIGGSRAARILATTLTAIDLASLPPSYRLSGDAVRNRAARELGRDTRAVASLVECLDDDFIMLRPHA